MSNSNVEAPVKDASPVEPAANDSAGKMDSVKEKKAVPPVWWKSTYFWIAGVLFILGVMGLPFLFGPRAIRDPGQKHEDNILSLVYFGGAALMLVNGWLSHAQTVQHYRETLESKE